MFSTHKLDMEISGALNQYMNICRDAFDGSAAKLNINFKSAIIETLLLFMVIPRKINFTQLERYGKRCEQCYRQTFTKEFDWIRYNMELMNTLFDRNDRKAIAIDPSYISKSGKHTPWIGYFWSGCAGQAKRGLEILGVGAIDIDKRDCVMLKAEQTPDTITLDNVGCTLIDWYLKVLERIKDRLLEVSNYVVADAYFSKATFAKGLDSMGFHLVSRFRDDANLMYIHDGQPTGKRGRPKVHGDKIDFKHLDYTKIQEIETNNEDGKLYTLIAYSQAMKRKIRLVIWINKKGKHKLYFSTDINMSGRDVIDFYRTRFQIEFCYRDAKQFTGLYHSQARDIRRLDFAFNASFTAINAAKIMMKENSIPFSMEALKSLMFNSYLLDRFFKLSGIKPNSRIKDKLVKELIDIAAYQVA